MFITVKEMNTRVVKIAEYMVEHNATVRSTAIVFGFSKSTVHKYVTVNILKINKGLAIEVRKVLDKNKAERHIRGGNSTKEKLKKCC